MSLEPQEACLEWTPSPVVLVHDGAARAIGWCESQRDSEIPSGFVRCADGVVHRVEVVACAVEGTAAPAGPTWACGTVPGCGVIC